MEKHDAIGLFVQSEKIIKKFRELLKLNESAFSFRGQYVVKLCDVASDVNKVHQYIIDDKDGAKRLHGEMLNLRTLTRELRDEAFQKGFEPFAHNCDTIISIIDDMERWVSNNPIPETGEDCNLDTGDKIALPKVVPQNKAQIMMEVRNEAFRAGKEGDSIPFKECYKRLTEGKIKRSDGKVETLEIIGKQHDFELFKYCVERADISKIFKSKKKSYARLFMNDIAEFFANPSEYRKAAALAFNVKQLNVGTDGKGIRADYRLLMRGVFPDNANYQKNMLKKSK